MGETLIESQTAKSVKTERDKTYRWTRSEGEWFQVKGIDGGRSEWINVQTPHETIVVIGRGKIRYCKNHGHPARYGEGRITAIMGPEDTFEHEGHFVTVLNQARIDFSK